MGGSLNPEMGGKLQGVCMCHPEGLGPGGGGGTGLGLVGTWSRWRADDGGKRTLHSSMTPSYMLRVSYSLFRKDLWRACYVADTVLTSGDTETHKPRSCPLRVL